MFVCTPRTLGFLPAACRALHRMEKNNIEINQRGRLHSNWLSRIEQHQRDYQNINRRQMVNSITINEGKCKTNALLLDHVLLNIRRILMQNASLSEKPWLDRSKILGSYKLLFQPINIKIVIYS